MLTALPSAGAGKPAVLMCGLVLVGLTLAGARPVGTPSASNGSPAGAGSPVGGGSSVGAANVQPRPIAPAQLSPTARARLPLATTFTTVPGAPTDPDPFGPGAGWVTHPLVDQVIYARPGGPPVAVLPASELRSPTWVPVVAAQPGWVRVLLPSRPNRSTGWIYAGAGGLRDAYSAYRLDVDVRGHRLTVFDVGRPIGSWAVAVGAPSTPTPTGRTFLLASLTPTTPTYSPLILPLGTHSTSLDTFGGGPGTVAFHGWPDPAVFGHDATHGCVRVPADALRVLSRVPLGSSVLLTG